MRTYTGVVERDPDTGLYVGYVPGFPGAHTQAETLDELNRNLREVIELLLEDYRKSVRLLLFAFGIGLRDRKNLI